MKRTIISVLLFVLLPVARTVAVTEPGDAMTPTETLRRTELAFAASVRDRDPLAFASFIADDAVFVGARVLRGKEAICAAWSVFLQPDGPVLAWHPEVVEIAGDGEIGLTRGPYTLAARDADGNEQTSEGLFNSVWRLQDDGTWKIIFDAGCD